jgi:LmbE family N-acetylglucosaminyl deacetylase
VIHDKSVAGVVLSPHPDDAVLSAWSALRAAGDITVVNVFAKAPPPGTLGAFDPVFGVSDSAALVEERRTEDAAALATIGRSSRNLNLLDEQYRDAPLDPATVRHAIEQCVDRAARLWAPAGIGAHGDHILVRDAAVGIARDAKLPLSLYADLPYAIWMGWPPWVTGAAPRPYLVPDARWAADLASIDAPDGALAARPIVLGDAEAARKLGAIRAYRTQFELLNAGPLARLSNPEIIGYEVHWDVAF